MADYAKQRAPSSASGASGLTSSAEHSATPGKHTLVERLEAQPVQQHANAAAPDGAAVHDAAARGVATPSAPLPHGDALQRLFGRHSLSGVEAHTGAEAAASTADMGARAYATGNHVVLGGSTDLHTVAHEAAHVIQQRGGVQLQGGVGAAGDPYERHADAVADTVVNGKSAEALLDQHAGSSQAASGLVQRVLGEDEGIGERVGARGASRRMTARQRDMHGITAEGAREGRRNAAAERQQAARREAAEARRERGLWDETSRLQFTPETWTTMLASVPSQARADGVTVYRCSDGQFYPRKAARVGDEAFVTLDHKTNWKQYVWDNAEPEEDGKITRASATAAYNDTNNLELMSNEANSSKNGPRGVFD